MTGNWTDGKWADYPVSYSGSNFFRLSLNESFDIGAGKAAVFENIEKASSTSIWLDGYCFADYNELYTYGHVSSDRESYNC